jgi:hypothetical protein
MNKTIGATLVLLTSAGVCFAQPASITPMIQRVASEGAPLSRFLDRIRSRLKARSVRPAIVFPDDA